MSNQYDTKYYANENVVRIIAAEVVGLTLLALFTHWEFILILLAVDFALRAFTYQTSPLASIAKLISKTLKIAPKPIFAAPKKFAAGLGFGFTLIALILFAFQFDIAAYIVGSILILCAVLESAFKICIGCSVHSLIVSPIINSRNRKLKRIEVSK